MKKIIDNRRPISSKTTGSYQDSLIKVTKAAMYFTSAFFLAFAVVYWVGDYPLLTIWVNLAVVICSATGFVLIKDLVCTKKLPT